MSSSETPANTTATGRPPGSGGIASSSEISIAADGTLYVFGATADVLELLNASRLGDKSLSMRIERITPAQEDKHGHRKPGAKR